MKDCGSTPTPPRQGGHQSFAGTRSLYTRRRLVKAAGTLAGLWGMTYLQSMIPLVSAQQPTQTKQAPEQVVGEESTLAVPLASKPLGHEDFDNGNWLKPEYWEDSLEVPFPGNRPDRQAYMRVKESRHEKFPNLSVLVDAVTDTTEEPFGDVSFVFDTENMRYKVKDPAVPNTSGVYSLDVSFEARGGPLVNIWANKSYAPGHPFPSSEFCYKWSRGPSPIPGSDEARLEPHVLYGFLFSKEFLTRKYKEIGLSVWVTESNKPFSRLMYPASELDYVKTSFSGIPIPEFPWPTLVLAGGTVAAALATRRFTRREVLCLG